MLLQLEPLWYGSVSWSSWILMIILMFFRSVTELIMIVPYSFYVFSLLPVFIFSLPKKGFMATDVPSGVSI